MYLHVLNRLQCGRIAFHVNNSQLLIQLSAFIEKIAVMQCKIKALTQMDGWMDGWMDLPADKMFIAFVSFASFAKVEAFCIL